MTPPAIRLAIGAAALVTAVACGSSMAPSSATVLPTTTFHADVTDATGDAVASAGVSNPPDLVRGVVDVSGGSVMFNVQFAAGTLDRQSTRLTIELDTDQNPATGITGAAGLGIDYVLDMWARNNQTSVQRALPATCGTSGGACYADAGAASLTVGTDNMVATVPLAMLGNSTGRLNFRVVAYASPQPTTVTTTADVMPDTTLSPAHVP